MGTFTMATGLGMFAMGMVLILIMGLIILKVINTVEKNKQEEINRKEREKIVSRYGFD
tara:strand:- start:850 stop:1023 length:174 start_codon:yes stop_codon:yes gene_type:complete